MAGGWAQHANTRSTRCALCVLSAAAHVQLGGKIREVLDALSIICCSARSTVPDDTQVPVLWQVLGQVARLEADGPWSKVNDVELFFA